MSSVPRLRDRLSTVYLWKQKLKQANGKLSALAPGDKTLIHKRKRVVHPFIESFIIQYRTGHPGADKTTIAPVLAEACKLAEVKLVSESTVGRIIHDLKERSRIPKSTKITISDRTGKPLVRGPKHTRKKLKRKGFSPRCPGALVQMDTVSIFANGINVISLLPLTSVPDSLSPTLISPIHRLMAAISLGSSLRLPYSSLC